MWSLPLVVLSLVLFVVTGTYLLVINPHYAGLGNVFASTWTMLMLVKHVLVIGLVGLGVMVDRLIRRAGEATSQDGRESALRRLGWTAEGATGLGTLVILLTATAQVAA